MKCKDVLNLFHGTSSTDPQLICAAGFNNIYSSEGLWGKANYFAVPSAYSCLK